MSGCKTWSTRKLSAVWRNVPFFTKWCWADVLFLFKRGRQTYRTIALHKSIPYSPRLCLSLKCNGECGLQHQPPKPKLTSIGNDNEGLEHNAPFNAAISRQTIAKKLRHWCASGSNQHWRTDFQKSSEIEISFDSSWPQAHFQFYIWRRTKGLIKYCCLATKPATF